MMSFEVLLSYRLLFFIIGLQLQSTNGGLLDAVGILGNTLQTGTHGHTVPNLLNQVVGGVGPNQGNTAKIPNQMHPQQQVTMLQRPNVNNYDTTAPLNSQHVYPNQNYANNAQRPNVAFQQRPIMVQHQNIPKNGFNQQNTGSAGEMVFIPHNTAQNYHQNNHPITENQNELQNFQLQHSVDQQNMHNGNQNQVLNQNLGQNGFQHTVGQNNMQQLNNPLSTQNVYQNGHLTTNVGQYGNHNQNYNGQQGLSTSQQLQQPTNYGGSLPPISSVIHPSNNGNINHSTNGVEESGHRNDGHKDNGDRNDKKKPENKVHEDGKVHSATVHNVFFQAKPLIVDDIAKDDRDITLYYQN